MHTTMFFRKQEEGLQIFVKGWELYRKIIAHNYMNHREIITTLTSLTRSSVGKPAVLEVGSGDAYAMSQTFAGTRELSYTAIDMSEHALKYARQNLTNSRWKLDLRVGNMFDIVQELDTTFDIILAGYSLHHFGSDRKAILLKRFRPLLNPNGMLIVYDIFKREDESREDYLERVLAHCRAHWTRMEEQQMKTIHEHVRENDYPESIESLRAIANNCGFRNVERRYRDPDNLYAALAIRP